ncbi:Alpha/Beta hydrolase protein [Parasitella parasitica]|nr:Alpha/Beta hydrolase protein [Parasitella parasitica]
MGSEKYFFWFFESKSKPEEKPLTVWLNGGPGCSSMIGLWQENGPCRSQGNGTEIAYNPYTWTRYSNMLFIDQPSGVGYSYGSRLETNVESSAVAFYDAIQLFYEAFPKYSQLPFHLFGESFAGRYIPIYADYILQRNLKTPTRFIPIKSVGIGNGWINPLIQLKYSAQMACESNYGQLLPEHICHRMKENYKHCSKLIEGCYASSSRRDCIAADNYCNANVDGLFYLSGRNVYDVRQSSTVTTPPDDFIRLLDHPDLQQAIGVDRMKYQECADTPYIAMIEAGEGMRNSAPYLSSLLNHGIRVLNYVGDADYLCNWYGNYALTTDLKFNGSVEFNNQALRPWVFQGKEVGQFQSTSLLTFIRVYEAGHEVPYYQPKTSLAMFDKWISNKSIYTY